MSHLSVHIILRHFNRSTKVCTSGRDSITKFQLMSLQVMLPFYFQYFETDIFLTESLTRVRILTFVVLSKSHWNRKTWTG